MSLCCRGTRRLLEKHVLHTRNTQSPFPFSPTHPFLPCFALANYSVPPFTCKAGAVKATSGPVPLAACKCAGANCQQCTYDPLGNITASSGKRPRASTCFKCKSGQYLHDGACVSVCPGRSLGVGSGLFGRYCETRYVCANAKELRTGSKCDCGILGCSACRVDPSGSVCDRCSGALYLYRNRCLKECPLGTTEQVPLSSTAGIGRACLEPKF